ncbi:hypothetical protein GCM10022140_26780 [Rhodococcus aetherivorans]
MQRPPGAFEVGGDRRAVDRLLVRHGCPPRVCVIANRVRLIVRPARTVGEPRPWVRFRRIRCQDPDTDGCRTGSRAAARG